jgi:hypothetical protein
MAGALTDLIDLLKHKQALYARAFENDLAKLRIVHGSGLIDEAMRRLIEEDDEHRRRQQADRVA